jgi:hypothetical protein
MNGGGGGNTSSPSLVAAFDAMTQSERFGLSVAMH